LPLRPIQITNDATVKSGVPIYFNARRIQGGPMLRWALAFFVVALVAAVFGFLGIAVAAAGIARILFFIFLVLFLVSLVGGLVGRA
jgi:uncharacterized membrane protein YtjA (UPF0391 family)